MNLKTTQSEQFCEELYFMLMTSSLRDRIRVMGQRHGLNNKRLRNAILSAAESVAGQIEIASPARIQGRLVLAS